MIELFSQKPDKIVLPETAVLSPLPIDENISSLSAILLDRAYYNLLKQGCVQVDGISILDAQFLIPFKAKAWLDLLSSKEHGEPVDSRNIKKHKNDVFRLSQLLSKNMKDNFKWPSAVKEDMKNFLKQMQSEDIDMAQLGIHGKTKEELLEELKDIYL